MKTYVLKRPGEVINNLRVDSIIGYHDREPIYSCGCLQCHTVGITIPHKLFRLGTAKCTSSLHGRPEVAPSSSSAAQVISRSDGWSEYHASQRSWPERQQPQPPSPESQRRLQREREKAQWLKRMHDEHRRYGQHAIKYWDVNSIVPFRTWCVLRAEDRGRIMGMIAKEIAEKESND